MAQTLHDLYQVYAGLCQQRRMGVTENMGVYVKAHRVIHQTLNTVYTSLYEPLGKRMARMSRSRKNEAQFTAFGIMPQLFIFHPEFRNLELECSQYLF